MAWNPNIPTVTNRVQDDLDAIRENFQVLDGHLADTNNPHQVTAAQVGAPTQAAFDAHVADTNNPHNVQAQQVPYSSGVAGFTPADVKAALDALAGVRIVEMGSNSNGTYVRWENGLQVCYHRLTIGNPSGVQSFSWTYPAAFASSNDAYPMGIVAVSGSDTTVFGRYVKSAVMRYQEALATQTTFFVEFSSAPSTGIHIHAFAIGRWK